MSATSDATVYRPGFNPEFLARARAKQRKPEKPPLRLVPKEPEPRIVIKAITEEDVRRMESLADRKQKAKAAIIDANRFLAGFHGRQGYAQLASIVRRICWATGVNHSEILSGRRNKRVAFARQAIMYWACRRTAMSLPEIGRRLGGKDHTTVLHGKSVYPKKRAAMGRNLRAVR